MWRYNSTDELIHGYKYIKKIKTGNGYRYFYSQDEIDAYQKEKTAFKATDRPERYYEFEKRAYKKDFDTVDRVNKNYNKIKERNKKWSWLPKFLYSPQDPDKYRKEAKEHYKSSYENVKGVNDRYEERKKKEAKRTAKAESDRTAGYERIDRRERNDLKKINPKSRNAKKQKASIARKYAEDRKNWEDHWDENGNFHVTTIGQKTARKKKQLKNKVESTKKAVNKELHTTHKRKINATGPRYKKPGRRTKRY